MDQELTWTGAWQFRRLISQLVSAWSGLKKIANNQVHTKFISNLSLWRGHGQANMQYLQYFENLFVPLIISCIEHEKVSWTLLTKTFSDYLLFWQVCLHINIKLILVRNVKSSAKSGRCSSWAELGKCVSMVWTAIGKNSSCQNVNWQVWVQSPKFQLSEESRDSNQNIQSSSGMSWSEPNIYHAICK